MTSEWIIMFLFSLASCFHMMQIVGLLLLLLLLLLFWFVFAANCSSMSLFNWVSCRIYDMYYTYALFYVHCILYIVLRWWLWTFSNMFFLLCVLSEAVRYERIGHELGQSEAVKVWTVFRMIPWLCSHLGPARASGFQWFMLLPGCHHGNLPVSLHLGPKNDRH